jgi:type I restriction enzyme S subunit
MGGEWESVAVGELADSISDTHPMNENELVFLNTSDVFLGKVLHREYSAVRDWPGQAKKSIRRNDILFSEIRPANGRWAFIDFDAADFVVSTKLMVIRPRAEKVVPRFLYHFLTSTQTTQWLQHLAESRSGTFPQITFDQVAELDISLPSLQIQRTIAGFLDSIDDKIELNRRMSETLEEMARALFKSWFVDFDPVRAKAEGRDPGLPQPLADLFPSRLVDSELGEIPEGWEVKVLDNLSSIVLGGDWGVDEPSPGHSERTRCIRGADIPDLQAGGMGKMPFRYLKSSSLQKRVLSDGDIVVEISGGSPTQSTGRPALVSGGLLERVDSPLVCSNFCRFLRPIRLVYSKFLYLWLRELYSADEFFRFESGTTGIKNLAFTLFGASYKLCVPSDPVLTEFEAQVAPVFTRRQSSAAASDTLTSLRDTLLPKLISGELRVKNAEKFIEGLSDG